jgi:hypothetical protein
MQHARHEERAEGSGHARMNHYGRLLAMAALSFVVMYMLMYAMVDVFGNVFNNVNQVYMAGLMAAPMLLLELMLMGSMYPNKTFNAGLVMGSLAILLLCWIGIRQQIGVSDQQFVRSMIPHHAGAILMCKRNRLQDPELQQLCREIIRSQQSEVALMKAKLQ